MRRNMGRPRAAQGTTPGAKGSHGNGTADDGEAAKEQALLEALRAQGIDLRNINVPPDVLRQLFADCGLDPALAEPLLAASAGRHEGPEAPAEDDAGDDAADDGEEATAETAPMTEEQEAVREALAEALEKETSGTQANDPADAEKGQYVRDKLGRFLAGNTGGPGNPFGRHVARNRQIMLRIVTPETIEKLFGKLVAMALEGNIPAARLVLLYAIGKPTSAANPDRVEHEEWELSRNEPSVPDVMQHQNLGYMTHKFANEVRRGFEAGREQTFSRVCHSGAMQMDAFRAKQAERAERRRQKKEARQRRKKE